LRFKPKEIVSCILLSLKHYAGRTVYRLTGCQRHLGDRSTTMREARRLYGAQTTDKQNVIVGLN